MGHQHAIFCYPTSAVSCPRRCFHCRATVLHANLFITFIMGIIASQESFPAASLHVHGFTEHLRPPLHSTHRVMPAGHHGQMDMADPSHVSVMTKTYTATHESPPAATHTISQVTMSLWRAAWHVMTQASTSSAGNDHYAVLVSVLVLCRARWG